jgi:hypothetical protein
MATMFVRHKVNDYDHWKRAYDDFAAARKESGVTSAIITHQFKDVGTAKAFADSEKLKSAMMDAGVTGPPEIWFSEDIERTDF